MFFEYLLNLIVIEHQQQQIYIYLLKTTLIIQNVIVSNTLRSRSTPQYLGTAYEPTLTITPLIGHLEPFSFTYFGNAILLRTSDLNSLPLYPL